MHAEPLGLRGAQVGNLCIKETLIQKGLNKRNSSCCTGLFQIYSRNAPNARNKDLFLLERNVATTSSAPPPPPINGPTLFLYVPVRPKDN